jgi:hypothetical protein
MESMDSAQCCAVMFMLLGEPRILFRMVQIRMMEREKAIDPGDSKQQAAKSHLESGACREADNVDGCASTSDHISPRQTIRTHTHARTDHRSSAPSMDALPLSTGCVTSSRRFCAVFFPGRPVFAYVGSGSGGACAWPADLLFMFKSLYTSST